MAAINLTVNRLIRICYGPFRLGDLQPGDVQEVRGKVLRDQLGPARMPEDTACRSTPAKGALPPKPAPKPRQNPAQNSRKRSANAEAWQARCPSRRQNPACGGGMGKAAAKARRTISAPKCP